MKVAVQGLEVREVGAQPAKNGSKSIEQKGYECCKSSPGCSAFYSCAWLHNRGLLEVAQLTKLLCGLGPHCALSINLRDNDCELHGIDVS